MSRGYYVICQKRAIKGLGSLSSLSYAGLWEWISNFNFIQFNPYRNGIPLRSDHHTSRSQVNESHVRDSRHTPNNWSTCSCKSYLEWIGVLISRIWNPFKYWDAKSVFEMDVKSVKRYKFNASIPTVSWNITTYGLQHPDTNIIMIGKISRLTHSAPGTRWNQLFVAHFRACTNLWAMFASSDVLRAWSLLLSACS